MKKTLLSFLLITALALFTFSCADSGGSGGGGGGGGGTTVDTPTEVGLTDLAEAPGGAIAPSGSGAAVADEAQAATIGTELSSMTSAIGESISTSAMSAPASMRATTIPTETISATLDLSTAGIEGLQSGTVTYTGTMSAVIPDDTDMTMTGNPETNDFPVTMSLDSTMSMDYSVSITYEDIMMTGSSYTVSGFENTNMAMDMTLDMTLTLDLDTSGSEPTLDISSSGDGMSLSLAVSYRSAYALSGDTVTGYVVTAVDIAGGMSAPSSFFQQMFEAGMNDTAEPDFPDFAMTTATASMTVYNAAGETIFVVDMSNNSDFMEEFTEASEMIGDILEGFDPSGDSSGGESTANTL